MKSVSDLMRTTPQHTAITPLRLSQEEQIMAVGRKQRWPFRIVGIAPVPTEPIYLREWWLVPLGQDTSPIPSHALERVRALYEAGITPKAFVIAHKAEKQLAPPAGTRIISPAEYWSKRLLAESGTLLKIAGRILVVVTPLVIAAVGSTLFFTLVVAGMLVADPILFAITDEEVWIKLDEWMA